MAVTLDNLNTYVINEGYTDTISQEILAGQVFVVAIGFRDTVLGDGSYVQSVTWNGVSLTQWATANSSAPQSSIELWYISSSSSVTANLVITFANDFISPSVIAEYTTWIFVGADTISPLGAATTASGSDDKPTATVTALSTSDLIIDHVCYITDLASSFPVAAVDTSTDQIEEINNNVTGTLSLDKFSTLNSTSGNTGTGIRSISAVGPYTMNWLLTDGSSHAENREWVSIAVEVLVISTRRIRDVIMSPGIVIWKR